MNSKVHFLLVANQAHDPAAITNAFGSEAPGSLEIVQNSRQAIDHLRGTGPYADRSRFPLPDVVLLERQMPQGSELLRWLRGSAPEPLRELPVIILDAAAACPGAQSTAALY